MYFMKLLAFGVGESSLSQAVKDVISPQSPSSQLTTQYPLGIVLLRRHSHSASSMPAPAPGNERSAAAGRPLPNSLDRSFQANHSTKIDGKWRSRRGRRRGRTGEENVGVGAKEMIETTRRVGRR